MELIDGGIDPPEVSPDLYEPSRRSFLRGVASGGMVAALTKASLTPVAAAKAKIPGATLAPGERTKSARSQAMPTFRPDPTFYPTARSAMQAPPEELAYVARINPNGAHKPDAITVIDLSPASSTYGQLVGEVEMTYEGDELHHFGWNACSSMLCPSAAHPHVERRYLIAPALGSSRIYVIDTKPDPTRPRIVKTIEPEEVWEKTGYANGHTVHCGPDGIYVSAIGAPNGEGPGGIFVLDHDSLDVLGPWELDRGDQYLHYDFWWHIAQDTMVTSEWGTPNMISSGVQPDLLLDGQYGHRLHFWDMRKRKKTQTVDLGKEHQIALELRPAHDPTKAYGFVNSVVSLNDLSSSIWTWHQQDGAWAATKVIEIPAEPAEEDQLPPALKPFKAVPPLVTDIALSLDDKYLYVSCWGTGELRQYDVSDPQAPVLNSSLQIGGIVRKAGHAATNGTLNGGPQMVEVSRDGKRVYFTNSLYAPWDAQFYPDGIQGWMVKVNIGDDGVMAFDPEFFVDFGDQRPHQIRLQGGDSSTDSFCFA